jgi:hypothetical protein
MPAGGKRRGAGRPKGSKNRRTVAHEELVGKAAAEGITPLEVMLEAMRTHHAAGHLDKAAAVAKDAAPYMHARLAQIDQHMSGTLGTYEAQPIPVAEREDIPGSVDAPGRTANGSYPKALGH